MSSSESERGNGVLLILVYKFVSSSLSVDSSSTGFSFTFGAFSSLKSLGASLARFFFFLPHNLQQQQTQSVIPQKTQINGCKRSTMANKLTNKPTNKLTMIIRAVPVISGVKQIQPSNATSIDKKDK